MLRFGFVSGLFLLFLVCFSVLRCFLLGSGEICVEVDLSVVATRPMLFASSPSVLMRNHHSAPVVDIEGEGFFEMLDCYPATGYLQE